MHVRAIFALGASYSRTHKLPCLAGGAGVLHSLHFLTRRQTPTLILVAAAFAAQLAAYSPTVQITNGRTGRHDIFCTSDSWTLVITGGAPNAEVRADGYLHGMTNASGYFALQGTMSQDVEGHWVTSWTVGQDAASPSPLSFDVVDCGEFCSASIDSFPDLSSRDHWDDWSGDWVSSTAVGQDEVSATASVTPATQQCRIESIEVMSGNSIGQYQTDFDQWERTVKAYDIAVKSWYCPSGRPCQYDYAQATWLYPYFDYALIRLTAWDDYNSTFTWAGANAFLSAECRLVGGANCY
jgi:hypothetical protein